jgi:hypothetical protein
MIQHSPILLFSYQLSTTTLIGIVGLDKISFLKIAIQDNLQFEVTH